MGCICLCSFCGGGGRGEGGGLPQLDPVLPGRARAEGQLPGLPFTQGQVSSLLTDLVRRNHLMLTMSVAPGWPAHMEEHRLNQSLGSSKS